MLIFWKIIPSIDFFCRRQKYFEARRQKISNQPKLFRKNFQLIPLPKTADIKKHSGVRTMILQTLLVRNLTLKRAGKRRP